MTLTVLPLGLNKPSWVMVNNSLTFHVVCEGSGRTAAIPRDRVQPRIQPIDDLPAIAPRSPQPHSTPRSPPPNTTVRPDAARWTGPNTRPSRSRYRLVPTEEAEQDWH